VGGCHSDHAEGGYEDGNAAPVVTSCAPPTPMPLFKRKRRVLLLDDDASIRRLVSLLLRSHGFRVDEVTNGLAALDSIAQEEYSVLILDLMMPHEGGVTVMRKMRETDPAMMKRILLLTAAPPSVIATYEHEVGAVVQKPFEANALVAAVERVAT
jgi:DNA-binding response OmpR family regulator